MRVVKIREPIFDKDGVHHYEDDPKAYQLARKRANDRQRSKKYYYELNNNKHLKKRKRVYEIFQISKEINTTCR